MLALVFSYEARDPDEFERAYGPEGEWATFFHGGEGFVATELLRDLDNPGRYLVIDRWASAEAYNAFVAANQEECARRSDEARFYYDHELRFGTFEHPREL